VQINQNSVHNNRQDGKKLAIIIGINDYEADGIPMLAGAENDAHELCELLKSNQFEVADTHFLTGQKATNKAILKAISNIFRKETECNLVLFYFSGHGIMDESNQGYIAPYDIDADDPFVGGINMDEIRSVIYGSKVAQKASIAIIIDCCYAGRVIEGTKEGMRNKHLHSFFKDQIEKVVDSSDAGKGKLILASSEEDALSREKDNCQDSFKTNFHSHGAFSFFLLECLHGKAADKETGIVTFDSLRRYIENQMEAEKKQKPIYNAGGRGLEDIRIAISTEQHKKRTLELIESAESQIANDNIQTLANASKTVAQLIEHLHNSDHPDVIRLINEIQNGLKKYKEKALAWLLTNDGSIVSQRIREIDGNLYQSLFRMAYEISFENLKKIEPINLRLLIILSDVSINGTSYDSPSDPNLEILMIRLKAATTSPASLMPRQLTQMDRGT
jgi:uncharacterized caspase-like protein